MIILAGTIRLPADKIGAARPYIEAMVMASRGEPGCIAYSFAFDATDEGLVRIFEVFSNEEALAAHRASPHMATWRANWSKLDIGERNMTQYDIAKFQKT